MPSASKQVVTNLLSNAVSYGASDAPIKVDVAVEADYARVS
jgi:signal transduction histidine kinase